MTGESLNAQQSGPAKDRSRSRRWLSFIAFVLISVSLAVTTFNVLGAAAGVGVSLTTDASSVGIVTAAFAGLATEQRRFRLIPLILVLLNVWAWLGVSYY